MDAINDPKQAGERLLAFARENRLVQGAWHDEEDGREVACLLGAAAGISDALKCPASLMPAWMAHALPGLFDGQAENHAQAFAVRWGEAMIRPEWVRIDWDFVRERWMVFVVKQATDAAATAAASAEAATYAAKAAAATYATYAAKAAAAAEAAEAAAAAAEADANAADAAEAAADASYAAANAAAAAADVDARDAQADALMEAIEKAMEVARG